jgi:hypothetical protein
VLVELRQHERRWRRVATNRFDARPERHITGLTWTTGAAGITRTRSVVAGILTASRHGCSTNVERFFTGGLSGASVSLLRGGMHVRKVFAKGFEGRKDFRTELGALRLLDSLGDPRIGTMPISAQHILAILVGG